MILLSWTLFVMLVVLCLAVLLAAIYINKPLKKKKVVNMCWDIETTPSNFTVEAWPNQWNIPTLYNIYIP